MKRSDGMRLREILAMRLKALRKSAGHPLKHLAMELKIPISTLHAWETGIRFPSAENLERVARWHGLHPCELLARNCSKKSLSSSYSTKSGKRIKPTN